MTRWTAAVLAVALGWLGLLGLLGCSRDQFEDQLVIFAASSLTEPLGRIKDEFVREHPKTAVTIQFAGSQQLLTQIEHGATPDLFLPADTKQAQRLVQRRWSGGSTIFATNHVVLVVDKSAPRLTSLSQLGQVDRLVVAAPEVPVGGYTRQLLDHAESLWGGAYRNNVESKIVSFELNVKQVLAKVLLGEADAAFVYASDAIGHEDRLWIVEPFSDRQVRALYPVVVSRRSRHPRLAQLFVAHLLSVQSGRFLSDSGFEPASAAP